MLLLPLQLPPGHPAVEAPESTSPFSLGVRFQEVLQSVKHQMESGLPPPDPKPPSLAVLMANLLSQSETGDSSPQAPVPAVVPEGQADGSSLLPSEIVRVEQEDAAPALQKAIATDRLPMAAEFEGQQNAVALSQAASNLPMAEDAIVESSAPAPMPARAPETAETPIPPSAAHFLSTEAESPDALVAAGDNQREETPPGRGMPLTRLDRDEGEAPVPPRNVADGNLRSNLAPAVEVSSETESDRPGVRSPAGAETHAQQPVVADVQSVIAPSTSAKTPNIGLETEVAPPIPRAETPLEGEASTADENVMQPDMRDGRAVRDARLSADRPIYSGAAQTVAAAPSMPQPGLSEGEDAPPDRVETQPDDVAYAPNPDEGVRRSRDASKASKEMINAPTLVSEAAPQGIAVAPGEEAEAVSQSRSNAVSEPVVRAVISKTEPLETAVAHGETQPPGASEDLAPEVWVAPEAAGLQREAPSVPREPPAARSTAAGNLQRDASFESREQMVSPSVHREAPSDAQWVTATVRRSTVSADGPDYAAAPPPERPVNGVGPTRESPAADGPIAQISNAAAPDQSESPVSVRGAVTDAPQAQPQDAQANEMPPDQSESPVSVRGAVTDAPQAQPQVVEKPASSPTAPFAGMPGADSPMPDPSASRSEPSNAMPAPVRSGSEPMVQATAPRVEGPVPSPEISRPQMVSPEMTGAQVEGNSVSERPAKPAVSMPKGAPVQLDGPSQAPVASEYRAPLPGESTRPTVADEPVARPTAAPVADPGLRTERPVGVTSEGSQSANVPHAPVPGTLSGVQTGGDGATQDAPERDPRASIVTPRSEAVRSQTPFDVSTQAPAADAETPMEGAPVLDERVKIESRMPEGVSVRPDVRIDTTPGAARTSASAEAPGTLPDDATPDQIERTYRVTDQIVRSARVLSRNGASQVTLRLDPPELGGVTIRLSSQDQTVSGEITVENHKVRDIVTRHMGSLRETLDSQGVRLDQINVSVEDRGAHADRETFRGALGDRSGGSRDDRRERQPSSEPWTAPEPQRPSGADGRVDFVA